MSEKQDLAQNPFTALFTSVDHAKQFSAESLAAPSVTSQGFYIKHSITFQIKMRKKNIFILILNPYVTSTSFI